MRDVDEALEFLNVGRWELVADDALEARGTSAAPKRAHTIDDSVVVAVALAVSIPVPVPVAVVAISPYAKLATICSKTVGGAGDLE